MKHAAGVQDDFSRLKRLFPDIVKLAGVFGVYSSLGTDQRQVLLSADDAVLHDTLLGLLDQGAIQ